MSNEFPDAENRVSLKGIEEASNPEAYQFLGKIIESNSLDLRQYSDKVNTELKTMQNILLEDILSLNKEYAVLYKQLSNTENVLINLKEYLKGFDNELQVVS